MCPEAECAVTALKASFPRKCAQPKLCLEAPGLRNAKEVAQKVRQSAGLGDDALNAVPLEEGGFAQGRGRRRRWGEAGLLPLQPTSSQKPIYFLIYLPPPPPTQGQGVHAAGAAEQKASGRKDAVWPERERCGVRRPTWGS